MSYQIEISAPGGFIDHSGCQSWLQLGEYAFSFSYQCAYQRDHPGGHGRKLGGEWWVWDAVDGIGPPKRLVELGVEL